MLDNQKYSNTYFIPCTKKQYTVKVCKPPLGTKTHNYLENVDYITDKNRPFVITGTVGEQWIINAEKINKTYDISIKDIENIRNENVEIKTRQEKNIEKNYATIISDKNGCDIQTSWGDILHGKYKDLILCTSQENGLPNTNDMWIVDNSVFANTYSMKDGIKNLYIANLDKALDSLIDLHREGAIFDIDNELKKATPQEQYEKEQLIDNDINYNNDLQR